MVLSLLGSLLVLGGALARSSTRGSTLSSCSLHKINDFFAARSSLSQLGRDASFTQLSSLLISGHQALQLLLHLRIVGTGLFCRVTAQAGSTDELLLDLSLLGIEGLLLGLNFGLHTSHHNLVVRLGTRLDRAQQLSLALFGTRELLGQGELDALLPGALLGIATLAGQQDLVVLVAGSLLNLGELLMALCLSSRMLLANLLQDALALCTLKRRLTLLNEADTV